MSSQGMRQMIAPHAPLVLKTVFLTGGEWFAYLSEKAVLVYMEDVNNTYYKAVERVDRLGFCTFLVHFYNQRDAAKVVSRHNHTIEGCPVCIFLYDDEHDTVYTRHQSLSWQDEYEEKKQVIDIPRMDPQVPTTVLIVGIPYHYGVSADDIWLDMHMLGDRMCHVESIQCLVPAGIAIVDFALNEDATKAVNMKDVTLPAMLNGRYVAVPVMMFLLRPLPSDPADIPNTADTAIAGTSVNSQPQVHLQTEIERIEKQFRRELRRLKDQMEVQTNERYQVQKKLLEDKFRTELKHHIDQLKAQMQIKLKDKRKQMGNQLQKESLTQYEMEKQSGVKDLAEEMSRMKSQMETQLKAQVKAKVKMERDTFRLSSVLENMECEFRRLRSDFIQTMPDLIQVRNKIGQMQDQLHALARQLQTLTSELRKLDAKMTTQLRTGLEARRTQCQAAHTQHDAYHIQCQAAHMKHEAHQRQCLAAHTQHAAHLRQCQEAHTQHEAHQRQCQEAHIQHETHQRQCQEAHTQHEAHQRQCNETHEKNEIHRRVTSRVAADTQDSLAQHMSAEIVTVRGQLQSVMSQMQAIQSHLTRLSLQSLDHGLMEVGGHGLDINNPSEASSTSGES